jgi:DNA-binding NtrC family response regulator
MCGMVRPCFLIIDREFVSSISTRKLVIESAKFNVITAYSSAEAIETLKKYPAVNGVVLDAGLRDMPCTDLVSTLKSLQPKLPVIVVHAPGSAACQGADHLLESFDPRRLLAVLERLEPEHTAAIEKQNETLSAEQ